LQREMISSSRLPTSESLISLLGSGSGLTPSGDDFISGVLLVHSQRQSDRVCHPWIGR
jgi:hypothetical protein